MVDLAYWYAPHNMPLNPTGMWPSTNYGRVVEGLDELAAAGDDVFRRGASGEVMRLTRID
jgi:hypothetical protein